MTWWQRLWRRSQMEAQLDKELRFHLDQHAADLIARGQDSALFLESVRNDFVRFDVAGAFNSLAGFAVIHLRLTQCPKNVRSA